MSSSSAPKQPIEPADQRVLELEAEVRRLDARALDLENEVVRRGIKLSCANVALARAKIAFDETSRARESAVQDIAHDLRTPLTSIKGAAQNLLDGVVEPLSPGVREYIEIMHQQTERLVEVVNWLVDAMRLDTGVVEISDTATDLGELVSTTARGLEPIARARGIALSVEPSAMSVRADAPKLRQVLENLLGNALKFTETGGHVGVSMDRDRRELRVRLKDDGIGMAPETLERLFDRYYRAPSRKEGKGLGLLIAREIARKHGGDITVTSELGRGSEFVLRLPAVD